ncbi:STAM-binding protein-like [Symsagittifera roscoffensis]|uniref:STAM-binding protein-like n=1 Tax=Symsagittifera roscoffensis TaxID=84072 RepID=UPI00307C45F4
MLTPSETLCQLHQQAAEVRVYAHIGARMYVRSGAEMIRMGGVYMDEKNLASAYVLYTKYAVLALEKLPKHPGYSKLSPEDLKVLKKRAKTSLDVAEELKKRIRTQLDKEYERYEAERAENDRLSDRLAEDLQLTEKESGKKLTDEEREDYERRLAKIKEAERLRALSEANTIVPPDSSKSRSSRSIEPSPDDNRNYSRDVYNLIDSGANRGSQQLRPLLVPGILREKFAALAERNTERNVETCGVLCGKMSNNQFTVTVVVLPKQSGTSDSCLTSHEEELFEVQEKYDVITLGWIHTHPTQSAFLSSVDLHTQFSYQSMIPESVAIVYSPKYQQYQSFSITQHGLKVLSECREAGFHYHAKEPPLQQVSPHVTMDPSIGITTVDLRL